jgi:hypothetical protein
MSARKVRFNANQREFGIIWQPLSHPFRLRAGDVIRFNGPILPCHSRQRVCGGGHHEPVGQGF